MAPASGSEGMERLVERSMRNWEIAKAQRPQLGKAKHKVHPYIAISREYGSRAHFIGQKLAKALGWSYFHREILDFIAQTQPVRHRLFHTLDERQRSWLEEVLVSLGSHKVSGVEYFRAITRAVLTIAQHEPAVFVGRGAGFMLPPEAGLHVRTVAPLAVRVDEIARRFSMTLKEAGDLVAKTDRERLRFVESHFGKDAGDPSRYDLLLNTACFTDAALCELMIGALCRKCKLELSLS
jgi:cytidylate kinase